MTKEELLKRAKEVIEYYTIQGWGDWLKNDYHTSGCDMLRIEDLENNENMTNFLVELINIMEKYNINYSGVNGMLCNFRTKDGDNDIRFGISKLWFFLLTQEEMDKNIEKAKEYAYQKMLNKRVKFLLPDNLKCKQSEDEYYGEGEGDVKGCEIEEVGEEEPLISNKNHAEFTADIETCVELNHIETFTDENDIKNKICEKIANTIYQSTFYQIEVKDNTDLINKLQLKELEIDSTTTGIKAYLVSIKNVLFKIEYYDDDIQEYSLNDKIIRLCEITNIENDINITNIEITEPKWLLDESNNDGFFESDTEVDDRDDEDDENEELYYYDAVGSFTADIELNIGKVESNDVNEDLIDTCYEKVYDILESNGVSIDSDEDELFERIKIKELEDGTTLVTIEDVECSVQVFIEAHNLDEANDERWSAFSDIVDHLNYLKNLRDDYVSEAD